MKKFLLPAILTLCVQLAMSQDLKKVETAVVLKKMEDAKTEVDKAVADPKNQEKPEAWYWKARIYAALANDPALRTKYPGALAEANTAYQKYATLDPTFAVAKQKGAEGLFDAYAASFAEGTKAFNDKKWEEAGAAFTRSNDYINTIIKNKWTNANIAFDTTGLLYAGYAYQNAKKPEMASKYYSVLADNKVAGENYLDVYRYLSNYYLESKNEAQFKKYIAVAGQIYPKEPWEDYEMEYVDRNLTADEKIAAYDRDDAAGSLSEYKYLAFGDIFSKAKNDKSLDSAKQQWYAIKAAEAFKKAYAKNNQNATAAFNVGVTYYNIYVDYDDRYAANIRAMQAINSEAKPEKDPKKKAAADAALKAKTDPYRQANANIEKPLMDNLDMSIEWLEKSYNILKGKPARSNTEKNVINKDVDFLANLYAYKRDRVRAKDPKAFDAYDAKYKEYDALHSKF